MRRGWRWGEEWGGVQKSFRVKKAPGRGCKRGNEVQDEARGRNGGKWGGGQIHTYTEEVKKKKKHGHKVAECDEYKNEKQIFFVGRAAVTPHITP